MYINMFLIFVKLLKIPEIDGNWSRLHGATALEKFKWNMKKCFGKMFFWLFNSIDVFLHLFACRHCRRSTNQRLSVGFQAKVTILDQSESSRHYKWRLSTNQRALVTTWNTKKQLTSVIKIQFGFKNNFFCQNLRRKIQSTFLYSN